MITPINAQHIAQATLAREYGLLIAGTWRQATNKQTFTVNNPATSEAIASVPDADISDVQAAIDAAYVAQAQWSAVPAHERAVLLRTVARLMHERIDHLATVMTLEQGKPLSEARGEIRYAVGFLEWFAGEAERIYGMTIPTTTVGKRIVVLRQPVGVAALITPWNFPSAMLTRKIGPALAAGCAVVCKPAEQTPLSALELGCLFIEAGAPAGLINILTMHNPEPFAEAVFADERVRKISFTGSTEVGRELMQRSAAQIKRISLELGGNAPLIVFDDADLDTAVAGTLASKFRNAGQTCVCANRIFVQRGIYQAFAERFVTAVNTLMLGNGLQPDVDIGPLIDQAAFEKVQRHTQQAIDTGAQILTGGQAQAFSDQGYWWQPTVLGAVDSRMLIAQEETFGPVAPLIPFDSEADVLRQANDSPFGLAAYFFTQHHARVWRVAEALEYGIIGANDGAPSTPVAPFGGWKQSGLGREGGPHGIDEYLETKYISLGS